MASRKSRAKALEQKISSALEALASQLVDVRGPPRRQRAAAIGSASGGARRATLIPAAALRSRSIVSPPRQRPLLAKVQRAPTRRALAVAPETRVGLAVPDAVREAVCRERAERREVLHALRKVGGSSSRAPKRRSWRSSIRC